MTSSRTALLAAVAAAGLLAGCAAGDASQSKVQEQIEGHLVEDGYRSADGERIELTAPQAAAASSCVAQTMFESTDFTKDERNEVARASDGDRPDEELVTKVADLVDECVADATGAGEAAGPEAPSDDEG